MKKTVSFLQNSLESETLVPNKARLKPSVPSFAKYLVLNLSVVLLLSGCGEDRAKPINSKGVLGTSTENLDSDNDGILDSVEGYKRQRWGWNYRCLRVAIKRYRWRWCT